jgi:hypothetical protein
MTGQRCGFARSLQLAEPAPGALVAQHDVQQNRRRPHPGQDILRLPQRMSGHRIVVRSAKEPLVEMLQLRLIVHHQYRDA